MAEQKCQFSLIYFLGEKTLDPSKIVKKGYLVSSQFLTCHILAAEEPLYLVNYFKMAFI